ncbi:helix-turn-helix domain-containing protein [Coraliomargarita sp. SDUM461004]|uniref:Helix-turn-helix domain-containing protein n=1 Tax=Thalassobacterium sedimentorum TaxID=3041258 RepID=A0ABU1AFN6_9BACT|nr:helix-turn-helix domain-containing protein [Coraliomargarita sp. SDUM461004]MDQ8193514.1 helix-turn-helix domain-containing protein [Coraliomargarita sp. SDUM461004]
MKKESVPSHNESSAPALERGLRLLKLLEDQAAMSLDQISRQLETPKASTLRLLTTLEHMGIVRKHLNKEYQALFRLQPLHSPLERFRDSLKAKMATLVASTACTAEWYEPTQEGMQLIHQTNPETELCVQARPGFLRDWHTEFEAVICLGHAFASQAPSLEQSQRYTANGILSSMNPSKLQKLVQTAKSQQTAYDLAFNSNGVRRFAAAAFDPENATFLGVLAVAEVYHFAQPKQAEAIIQSLTQTLKQ